MVSFRSREPGGLRLLDVRKFSPATRGDDYAKVRALCDVAYLGGETALCRALGRYKMFVDTTDNGIAPHLMLDGYWEMWVTEALATLVKPGMVVADIGANLGYFSLLMADMVGAGDGGGRVHAFEPNPRMVSLMRRSVSVNGFSTTVTIHDLPLGDADDHAVGLRIPDGDPKNAHIVDAQDGDDVLACRTRRLDSIADCRDVALVKIDVDGSEERVIDGMSGLLTGPTLRTIVLEFSASRYGDPAGFLDRLLSHGFALSRITYEDGIVAAGPADILAADPFGDLMLVLHR